MIEILRVLADGTTTSPARSAVSPVFKSLKYQLVVYGCSSQRAFSFAIRSDIVWPPCAKKPARSGPLPVSSHAHSMLDASAIERRRQRAPLAPRRRERARRRVG